MKVLIVGYGSMGKRRIRLLQQLERGAEFLCVDKNPSRLRQASEQGLRAYEDLAQALEEKPELAFVCTSPGNHAGIILKLVEAGIHVFTELNLVDHDYGRIIALAEERNTAVFMSSTMLYDKRIETIDRLVKAQEKPLTYLYHVGQYLPDWHPWESYKDFFIGKKETNGVREILAIQLPWLLHTFGKIEELSVMSHRCTKLEIDFDDSVSVTFRHESGAVGVFVADTVSRKAAVHLEIIGEDIHLLWDGHNDDLCIYDLEKKTMRPVETYDAAEHADGYADHIIENRYADEIADFLATVYQNKTPRYSLANDQYTLKIIDEIEGHR